MKAIRPSVRLSAVLCIALTSTCAPATPGDPEGDGSPEARALADEPGSPEAACTTAWSPTWHQESANHWWVEYSITGGTTQSAYLDVPGSGQVPLALYWGKWMGSSGFYIASGAPVVLHATNDAGVSAQTYPFGYLDLTQPLTDLCNGSVCTPNCIGRACGDDGCGGVCGTCPQGQMCGSGACVCAPNCAGRTCGDDGCGGVCGTCGAGRVCTEGACVCAPNCAGRACGADGCGGVCGTCAEGLTCSNGACQEGCVPPWDPVWEQGGYSGQWWVQYAISGGSVQSAYLEVVGAGQVPLTYGWGSWSGSPGFQITSGAQVILHATDTTGRTAQTLPYVYLTTTQPETDPCAGTAAPGGCEPFPAGMVSITFDDGLVAQYTLARPMLLAHDMLATLYLTTAPIAGSWWGYLTLPQAQALAADGHEIGSHTVTHPYLTQLAPAQLDDELGLSKLWLETNLGVPVTQIAAPYGATNTTVAAAAEAYYASLRTVDPGLNYRGDDPYALKNETIVQSVTPSQVAQKIDRALALRGWTILLFHNLTAGSSSDPYTYPTANFEAVLDYIDATGIEVVTVGQGAERIRCPQ